MTNQLLFGLQRSGESKPANHCQQRGRKFFKPAWLADFERHSELRDIHVQGQHLTARYDRASESKPAGDDYSRLVAVPVDLRGFGRTLHQAGFHVARLTLRDHGITADLNRGCFIPP